MEKEFNELKEDVYTRLDMDCDISESQLNNIIEECIYEKSRLSLMSIHQKEQLKKQLYNSIKRFDILQELLEDEAITEIMINGYKDIFIEKNGHIEKWNKCFDSILRLEDIAQRIAALSNRLVNEASPIVDTRLDDGSRVNIVLPPIALNEGPVITIRKFYKNPITIQKLIAMGSISRQAADFLMKAVRARYNIFISGGTGSGKTTFLNALSDYIPKDERIITIEDSAELQIHGMNNLVRLEARNSNQEGMNGIAIRELIKSSLRMRPDRIIVGEIRGVEALDMLQAMNTGHDGSISTGHGNSPKDMLSRITTMVLMGVDMPVKAIEQQIASAIDIVVHLGRLRDKTRRVLEIDEIAAYEKEGIVLNTLFKFAEEGTDEAGKVYGSLKKMEGRLVNTDKMHYAGITEW
ncbi:MAG: CpaF family protein [Eubacteriales bacterium]|nr:CpaF family protein [Eubacteriales bacterium]